MADDVNTTLQVEKAFLEAENLRVFATTSPRQVLTLAAVIQPALIVLDYEMPELKGDEICRRLKANPDTAGIPVLLLSSHDDEKIARACAEAGAVKFVRKAEGREALLTHVTEILGLAHRRHVRVQCQIEVGLKIGEVHLLGFIHNLSEGGLYLTIDQSLSTGDALHLHFGLPDTNQQIDVLGEVVRTESLGSSLCGYGIQLLTADEASLQALRAFVKRTQQHL